MSKAVHSGHGQEQHLPLDAEYVHRMKTGAPVITKTNYGGKDKPFNHDSAIAGFYLPCSGLLNDGISYEPPAGHWNAALFGTNRLNDAYKGSGFGHAEWGRPSEYGIELTVNI